MSCLLTAGRTIPCKDVVGGIKAVYFVNFGDITAITESADEVTDMTGTFSAYKYDLKGNS